MMFILPYSTFTMTVLEVSCKTERKTEFRNPAEVNRKKNIFLQILQSFESSTERTHQEFH